MVSSTSAPAAAELRPFVPRLVLEWAAETPEARYRCIDGTLVFTDLSGFTAMSERLSRLGRLGAEELTTHLDATFASLLDVANDRGGTLLKFGGDALLLFFWGDDHARRGVAAAHEMREALRTVGRIQTEAGRFRLRMSVGVHSGAFDFFLAGETHRELVITGSEATTAVEMEATADAGEILLSRATADLLPPGCSGDPKGDGVLLRRKPRVAAGADADLAAFDRIDPVPYVPASLRDPLARPERDAEHRQATVAFLHIVGVDEAIATDGPDEAARRLDDAFAAVQRHFDSAGVTFLIADVYDDGPKIMAVSGAPVSQGNDEERMLRALRAIADEPLELGVRVGVNRGYVFAGEVGTSYRRTYTTMGDATNTAARVMARAQRGQVLATPAVLERSQTAFETEELEPFAAKGKSKPLIARSVGAIAGVRDAEAPAHPLIGRARELSVLTDAVAAAREGHGSVVQVVAEPGMGKSRLITELRTVADVPVVRTSCDRYASTVAYAAARPLLEGVLGVSTADALRALVEEQAADLLPWLPLVAIPLELDVPMTEEVERLHADYVPQRMVAVVTDLVGHAVAAQPQLWLVEDGHWADAASSDLLGALAARLEEWPVLLCVTRRDADGGFAPDGEVLRLEPLSPEAIAQLARLSMGRDLLPHDVAMLAQRSSGNPMFLVALSRAMADSVVDVPDNVEMLVGAKVDALDPDDRTLLRQLSVLGTSFSIKEAASYLGVAPGHLEAQLVELDEFLAVDSDGVSFRHALYQEVPYAGLSYRRRRTLHHDAGRLLERDDEARERPEVAALHFFRARSWPEARRYAKVAAARAEERYLPETAAHFHRMTAEAATEAGAEPDVIVEAWRACGRALRRAGRYADALAAYQRAKSRSRQADPRIDLVLEEAELKGMVGRPDLALRAYRKVINLPHAGAARGRVFENRAYAAYVAGDFERALDDAERAMSEYERASDATRLAPLAQFRVSTKYELGETVGEHELERCLDLAEQSGDRRNVAGALGAVAYIRDAQGRWNDALDLLERAASLFEECGVTVAAAISTADIGAIRGRQGHYKEAARLLGNSLAVCRAAGIAPSFSFRSAAELATVTARAGDARHGAAGLRSLMEDGGLDRNVPDVRVRLAECLLRAGQREDAHDVLESLPAHLPASVGAYAAYVRGWLAALSGNVDLAEASFNCDHESDPFFRALLLDGLAVVRPDGPRAPDWRAEADRLFDHLGVVVIPRFPEVVSR